MSWSGHDNSWGKDEAEYWSEDDEWEKENAWNCAVLPDHVKAIVGHKGRIIAQIERDTHASVAVTSSRGQACAVDKNVVVWGGAAAKKKSVLAMMNVVHKCDGISRMKLFIPREIGDRALAEGEYDFEKIKWDNDGVWVEGSPQEIADLCSVAFSMERPSEVVALKLAFPHKMLKKLIGTKDRKLPEYRQTSCQIDACFEQVPNTLNPVLLIGLQNEKLAALQVILEKLEQCGEGIMQVVMVLPSICVQTAIGTLGNNVIKLESETSCKIEFARDDQDNVVLCSCKITGPAPENVLEAVKLLDEIAAKEPRAFADKEFSKLDPLPLKRPKPVAIAPAAAVEEKTVEWTEPAPVSTHQVDIDLLVDRKSVTRLSRDVVQKIEDHSTAKIEIDASMETLVKVRGGQQEKKLALEYILWELAGEAGPELDRIAMTVPSAREPVRVAMNDIEDKSGAQFQFRESGKQRNTTTRVDIRGTPTEMITAMLLLNEVLCTLPVRSGAEDKNVTATAAHNDATRRIEDHRSSGSSVFPPHKDGAATATPYRAPRRERGEWEDERSTKRRKEEVAYDDDVDGEPIEPLAQTAIIAAPVLPVPAPVPVAAPVQTHGTSWSSSYRSSGHDGWNESGGYRSSRGAEAPGGGWWDERPATTYWRGESSESGWKGGKWGWKERGKGSKTGKSGGKSSSSRNDGWNESSGAWGGDTSTRWDTSDTSTRGDAAWSSTWSRSWKDGGADHSSKQEPAVDAPPDATAEADLVAAPTEPKKQGDSAELVLLLDKTFKEKIDTDPIKRSADIEVEESTVQGHRALTLSSRAGNRDKILEGVRELCQIMEQIGHLPTLTVWMQPWVLGMIVGRKGCNVMEAQRTSGCRMDVSRTYSTLTVSGDYMEQVAFGIEHALALAKGRW